MVKFPQLLIVTCYLLGSVVSFPIVADLRADENWPRFRGPNGTGIAKGSLLPTALNKSNIRWQVKLKGTGSSSPVAWGPHVFLTSFDDSQNAVVLQCLDIKQGTEVWSKAFPVTPTRLHKRNSLASSTPAVDRNHVYLAVCDQTGAKLVAMDHQGTTRWTRELGPFPSQHGFGASPIVVDNKVVLFCSQQAERMRPGIEPGDSHLIAFSPTDGSVVWKASLKATRACYSVPALIQKDGQQQLVGCNTGNGFFGIDPSNGKMLWTTEPFKMRTVASMLWAHDRLIGSCGSGGGGNYLVALQPEAANAKKPFRKAYEIKKANYVPSPLAINEKLMMFTDKGIARCFHIGDGKILWEKRIARGFSGSPVASNGHAYIIDESGKLWVMSPDSDGEPVAYLDLGEGSRATPAIIHNQLLVRTESQLVCIAK